MDRVELTPAGVLFIALLSAGVLDLVGVALLGGSLAGSTWEVGLDWWPLAAVLVVLGL